MPTEKMLVLQPIAIKPTLYLFNMGLLRAFQYRAFTLFIHLNIALLYFRERPILFLLCLPTR